MNVAPPRLLGTLAVAVLLGAAGSAFAHLDPPEPAAYAGGTHVLRRILYNQECQPVTNFAELKGHEKDCLVIVLGDLGPVTQLPGGLRDFLRNGGAVLLASDYRTPRPAEDAIFGVTGARISHDYAFLRADPEDCPCHRSRPERPFAVPAPDAQPDLFRTENGVATNIPACLDKRNHKPGLRVLAYLPPGCVWGDATRADAGELLDQPGIVPLAVGGDVGPGRVLFVADHSIFVNGMMAPTDDSNVEFADAAVRWLAERGDGRRTRVLFVEDGVINPDFNVPLAPKPKPPIDLDHLLDYLKDHPDQALDLLMSLPEDRVMAVGDEALAGVEKDGVLDREAERRLWPYGRTPELARGLVLAAGVAALLFGLVLLVRRRYRPEPGLPTLPRVVGQQTPRGTPLEERQRALLRADNLWEAARGVARAAFAAALPEPQPGAGRRPPRVVVVGGGWWHRWRTRRRVAALWRLAYGPRPRRLRLSGWRPLLRDADGLRAGLADGTIRLEAV